MECVSPNHLHADGRSGRSSWSSLQQLEHHPLKVSNEISPQERKNLEVRAYQRVASWVCT